MLLLSIMMICLILASLYIRYCPVGNVKCTSKPEHIHESIEIVDVRDYNQSYKDPVLGATNIPYAYMKRSYSDISKKNIHVIASNYLERNISIRFLRRRGFQITGYTLMDCPCKQEING